MSETENRTINVIDKLIYVFFIIFLLSLGNSIFVNQVGYFGALLLVLLKIAVTKENQFSRTGLELAFVLYLLAEILSLIFSEYQSEALRNLTKRAAIIPVFYTTIAATTNLKKGKQFFLIYIGGMLATILVYLFFSVQHYLNNLYGIVYSGPSVFQFPITTSEIISFTVLFLFAFLINEKTTIRIKIFTLIGFIISLTALVATFKRTGWIGTMFGVIVILIATRRWKTLGAALAFAALLFLIESNISEVIIYKTENEKLEKLNSFETDGRAYNFTSIDSMLVVADFDNGLLFYKNDILVKNVHLSGAVGSFNHIKDDYYFASLHDTRFSVLRKSGLDFSEVNELLSPGYTKVFRYENDMLYVLDTDSGLTVFTNPIYNDKHKRYPELSFADDFFTDSSYFYIDYEDGLQVREQVKFLPADDIIHQLDGSFNVLLVKNKRILINKKNSLELYDNNLNLLDSEQINSSVSQVAEDGENLYLLTDNNKLLKMVNFFSDSIDISDEFELGFTPYKLYVKNDIVYTSIVGRSRLLSIFDPYLQTNFTRLALLRAGWEMFKDNPFFGLGDIDLARYYLKYKRPFDKEIHGHLHNNYIHFLATLGLFGFIAITFLFIKMFLIMGRHFKQTKEKPFINSYALGAIAGLASTLFAGLTELNFWDQEIGTLIYFTVGLSVALFNQHKREEDSRN